jgi:hypothetical protein
MNDLILKLEDTLRGVLAGMYSSKVFKKTLMVTDEIRYGKMLRSLQELIASKYISVKRRGKNVQLLILKKGQKEIK